MKPLPEAACAPQNPEVSQVQATNAWVMSNSKSPEVLGTPQSRSDFGCQRSPAAPAPGPSDQLPQEGALGLRTSSKAQRYLWLSPCCH